jgi:6-phosphofructokinase 1
MNFANMAIELIRKGSTGRMVTLKDGRYAAVDINMVTGGAKRVDVEQLYDAETYRPRIKNVDDKPMFLY